ncbi:hypothetical protein [Paenibacillus sp. BAC0078]
MAQQTMYLAMNNSPGTELSAAITAASTSITVISAAALPAAPNLITIGTDDTAEVVLYTGISGNTLTGCTRGFGGTTARSWAIAARVARYYTAADHNAFKSNIEDLDARMGRVDLTQTLGPGTSVLTADQNGSELDLAVNGRTLVNLLGSAGNGESLTGWSTSGSAPTVSTTQKRSGSSSFKCTPDATKNSYIYRDFSFSLDTAKNYLIGVWVFIESATTTAEISLRDVGTFVPRYISYVVLGTVGSWQFIYIKVPSGNALVGNGFRLLAGCGSAGVGVIYIDDIRLYEVTAAEYAAIGTTITGEAIDAYLPYVDGKQHVQGAAITKQGRNLFPGTPGTLHANARVNGPYDLTLTATADNQHSTYILPVVGGATYTIKFSEITGVAYYVIKEYGGAGSGTQIVDGNATLPSRTFTLGSSVNQIIIYMTSLGAGITTFKNWQLELGGVATPFTPAEPQTAILPVTLGEVGGIRDSVYSQGTEWMYVNRLKRDIVAGGALAWTSISSATGYKEVRTTLVEAGMSGYSRLLKYNGAPVKSAGTAEADSHYLGGSSLYVRVATADSGWGDSYTPSSAEISAYFYGYRMNNGTFGTAYNGTGTKTWTTMDATSNTGAVTTVPAAQAPITTAWTPYVLDYALANVAAPVAIPNAEGSITLHPGGNQISVETGVIQREKVVPKLDSGNYYIVSSTNTAYWGAAALKRLASKILSVYQGADLDSRWIINSSPNARLSPSDYDASKDYYVTYLALDKYALSANVVETAATWRTGLGGVVSDVVQSVAELRQADDRQDFAIDYAEAKTDNLRLDFTAHQVDYVRQPGYIPLTTGGPTAYAGTLTPPPTAGIVEGFGVTAVFNATNAANPTLNINGLGAIALKDQKGVAYAAGKLVAGKPYTFRRVGTDFLADSAGGSGDAVAGDIRAGKKAATDAGDVTGTLPVQTGGTVTPGPSNIVKAAGIYDVPITVAAVSVPAGSVLTGTTIAGTAGAMPNRSAENIHMPGNASTVWAGDRFFIQPPAGYYDGSTWVTAGVPGLTPNNVRKNVQVADMVGTLVEGKPFASGTYSSPNAWDSMTITGLAFTPRTIIIRSSAGGFAKQYVYLPVATGNLNNIGLQWSPDKVVTIDDGVTSAAVSWSINAGGFSVNFGYWQQVNVTYTWECYGA